MQVVAEGVRVSAAQVAVNAADGQVHLAQPPGGGGVLLSIDIDIVFAAWCSSTKRADWTNMPPEPQRGHGPCLYRVLSCHQQFYDAGRGIEFTLAGAEFAQEVFIDPAQDILRFGFLAAQVEGEQVDQFAQLGLVQLRPGIVFEQHPF